MTRHIVSAVFVAVGLALALAGGSGAVGAGQSGARLDRISFTAFTPDNWDVYLFGGDGRPPRRITDDSAPDYDAVLSPDGRWLVFCSERDGDPDLYAIDLSRVEARPQLLIDSDAMEDQATFTPDGRAIVFVGTSSGNADIYRLAFRPERTATMAEAENLTQHARADLRPSVSPDGTTVAFSSDRDSAINTTGAINRVRDGDIYAIDLQTKRTTRLTSADGWDGSPAWSPDGTTVAFYSQRGTKSAARLTTAGTAAWAVPEARIWLMNADGSNQRVATPDETLALSPTFVADGRIAYSRKTPDGTWQIASIRPDGTGSRIESGSGTRSYWHPSRPRSAETLVAHGVDGRGVPAGQRMTISSTFATGPFLTSYAPFPKALPDRTVNVYPLRVFAAVLHPIRDLIIQVGPLQPELIASRIDGTERRSVFTFLRRTDGRPGWQSTGDGFRWSRDGQWLLVTQGEPSFNAASEADIWKMRFDGAELQNLTPNSPGNDNHPGFSGDGKEVVFRSGRSGNFDLYLMNADGTHVRRLTNDPANDLFPVFSPAARQIAFASNRDHPSARVYDLYLMDLLANGAPGAVRRLTNSPVQKGHLAFSPDGKWLLYASEGGGINDEEPLVQSVVFGGQSYGEIYALRLSDGTVVRLTHNKWEEGAPSWEAGAQP